MKVKVKFLKQHLHYAKDVEIEANKPMAEYWVRMGVAKILPKKIRAKKPKSSK